MTKVGFGKRAAWAALVVWTVSATGADVGRTAAPPAIDGRLDESCWKSAEWHSDLQFMKNYVDDGTPRKDTAFAVTCDEAALYLAVKCAEPDMAGLRARPDTGLWSECVEFYLSPGKTTFEYYQFAIGPATKDVFAQFYSEGGNIRPDPYRPVWKQAISFGEKEWTAEIAIPLSALYMTRNKDWKETWLFNFIRTTKTGKKPSVDYTWSPLRMKNNELENFRTLGGFPMRAKEEDVVVRAVNAEIERRDGDGLKGVLKVDIQVGTEGEYEVACSSGASRTVMLKAGDNRLELPCVYGQNGRSWTHFKVTKKGFARGCERDYPVRIDFHPIRVKLTCPAYRNNFYPGQSTDIVAGEVAVSGGKTAELVLEGPGFPRRTATVGGTGAFRFDTRGFSHGDAWLTVTVGKDVEKVRIRNLPPSGHRMTWIENGCLVVDGKPVFRRTLDAEGWHQGKANFERFQRERESFCMTENFQQRSIEAMRAISGIEQREGVYDRQPSDEVFRKMDEAIAAAKDKDFGCWFLIDEPECRNISPVWLKAQYDYLAEKDPYHVISTDSRGGKLYMDCIDVVQTHPYVAPVNCEDGVRRYGVQPCDIGSYLDAFEVAGRPDKCIGLVPQSFAYRWYSTRNDYPTLEEFLCTSWAGVIRGARSIRPYACHDMGDRAYVWEGTRYLLSSIAALEDYLLFARRTTLEKSKVFETTLYELKGERMVVAVNFTKDAVRAKLPGVTGKFREFRGPRTFAFGAGDLALKPFEVVVATTDVRDAGLESFAAMAKRAAEGEAERLSHDSQIMERHDEVVLTSNFGETAGGKLYKLIDGSRDMFACASVWRADPFVEMEFPRKVPTFERIRVYGFGLDNMQVEVRRAGEWMKLTPKSVRTEKYLRELEFGETVRAVALRFTFPSKPQERNEVELYEIELPKSKSGAADAVRATVKPLADEGVLKVFAEPSLVTENVSFDLADDLSPKWAVFDLRSLSPKDPKQYRAWHLRYEPSVGKAQLLASLGGEPEEAGVYTIRFDPVPEKGRKAIVLRDYGLNIGFGGLTLLERPATRVDLRGPKGASEIAPGDTIGIKVSFALPCEDVSAEFLYAFKALERLRSYAVNGKSGLRLRKLDESGRVWGTTLKVEQLPADVPERCVYVKAQALGGGIDRPVFGNFAVPFVRCR